MAFVILSKLGFLWSIPPLLFLSLGSTLSRFARKPERRDFYQVLANGIVATVCAFLEYKGGYITSLSVSLSDTVATEIGLKFGRKTYLIINFKEVPPGTSGGISLAGTVSGLLCSFAMALYGYIMGVDFWAAFTGSLAGFFADSIMGATFESNGLWGNNTTNFLSTLIGLTTYSAFYPPL